MATPGQDRIFSVAKSAARVNCVVYDFRLVFNDLIIVVGVILLPRGILGLHVRRVG